MSRKAPPLSAKVALSSQSGGKAHDNQGQAPDRRTDRRTRVWQVVAMIPAGQVATYGQIAALIGLPSHARFVGTTLRQLPQNTRLPWHRVVNAGLRISQRGGGEVVQRKRLEAEGVEFVGGKIPEGFRWEAG